MQKLKLQYRTWDEKERIIHLGPGEHRIGRIADNDVVIDELAVSEYHCVITIDHNGNYIADADSMHGTFLDGAFVQSSPLKPGQTLNLGTLMISVMEDKAVTEQDVSSQRSESLPLKDGSYSCLKHQNQRAGFECPSCHFLFCNSCLPSESESPLCPQCGAGADVIDWSGIEMTPRDAALDLMPDNLKKAWGYWQKWKAHRDE